MTPPTDPLPSSHGSYTDAATSGRRLARRIRDGRRWAIALVVAFVAGNGATFLAAGWIPSEAAIWRPWALVHTIWTVALLVSVLGRQRWAPLVLTAYLGAAALFQAGLVVAAMRESRDQGRSVHVLPCAVLIGNALLAAAAIAPIRSRSVRTLTSLSRR